MIKGLRAVAIIPARGGSKGLPNKNIRPLGKIPLIGYTINAAKEARVFDAVVVSTDSDEIAKISKEFSAEIPFIRPDNLACDTAKTIDVVMHALSQMSIEGRYFDLVVLLQPTSPFRNSSNILQALNKFIEKDANSLVSVCEVHDNPILMRSIDNKGNARKLLDDCSTVRRQEFPTYYKVNGAIYINKAITLSNSTSLNDNELCYIMPQLTSIDIDTEEDLLYAEFLLKNGIMGNVI